MELIRGKTFIKSYGQNPVENVPSYGVKVKINAGSKGHLNDCTMKKNELNTRGMSSTKVMNGERNTLHGKSITKSKTHDCVTIEHKPEKDCLETGKNILSSSISFPGIDYRKKNESNVIGSSAYQQHIIDYRNFVPQMPFVPSVAKSLPRKRISLKRSRRGLKDIFSLKKNKQQDILVSENEKLGSLPFEIKKGQRDGRQHLTPTEEMYSDELLTHELSDNEMHIDSVGSCHLLCEDVASLKSFDSFTGCGEIFADESTAYIDMDKSKDGPKVMFITKAYPQGSNFQGGVEQLASPAKSEKIDFSRLSGQANSSERVSCPNSLFDTVLLEKSNNGISKESLVASRDQLSNSAYNDLVSSSENATDAGSPVSTSDEGYYDSFSPGTDDDKKYMGTTRPLPRDSYSGDALYELFCDSEDNKPSPVQDCVKSSRSDHSEHPASVYSFFVGSEENMASQPDNDLFRDGIPQSSWKGKECFLKLCDTELSLTMGLVNWLKKNGKFSESQDTNTSFSPNHTEKQGDNNSKSVFLSRESNNVNKENQLTEDWQPYDRGCSSNAYLANDPECPQKNATLAEHADEFSNSILQYHQSPPMSGLLSKDLVSLLKTLCNGGKYRMDASNQYMSRLTNIGSMHLLSSINKLLSSKQDNLPCLDPQYLRNCVSPLLLGNDKNLIQLMEQCTTQVASMHINPGDKQMDQEHNLHIESIPQQHELSDKVTHSMETSKGKSEQTLPHPVLSFTPELSNTYLETGDTGDAKVETKTSYELVNNSKSSSDSSEKQSKDCINEEHAKTIFTKGSKPQWFNRRTNFLPLFGTRCSSVMSHCPSTLYKVCNTGETIIFLNASNKCNDTFCNIDDLSKDYNTTTGPSGNKIDKI
uniref:APC membrane recruitment protein 3 n=1 Tax=Leptobrachium leishanense TaxID=445787 RepID=A0A8C5M8B2_9ANUR